MKKIFAFLLVLVFLLNFSFVITVYSDDINEGQPSITVFKDYTKKLPYINATAAIAVDMKSGRVLYEKNSEAKKSIASTTKIMTAILAIENGNLDDEVIISKRAAAVGGSSVNLVQGSKLKLKELLYGLMLNSGNDAAVAIAEYIGGSVEDFVDMMNEKAIELGAYNTVYKSPHGLDKPGQYSTAYDLALITRYALKNEAFSKIVSTKSISIGRMNLYNTNEMLSFYPGADGVKTGYTGQAGRCLVTSVTRDGWKVISVVLNSPTREARAQCSRYILDYAYTNYKPYRLVDADKIVKGIEVRRGLKKEVPVLSVDDVEMPLTEEEYSNLETYVELPEALIAPVNRNIEIGTLKFYSSGKLIAESPLKTADYIPKKRIYNYLNDIFVEWMGIMR